MKYRMVKARKRFRAFTIRKIIISHHAVRIVGKLLFIATNDFFITEGEKGY